MLVTSGDPNRVSGPATVRAVPLRLLRVCPRHRCLSWHDMDEAVDLQVSGVDTQKCRFGAL